MQPSLSFFMEAALTLLVALAACLPCLAADQPLFSDNFAFLRKTWTLQPPVNALGPIPPNATWKVESGALVAEGSAAPWSVMTAGDPAWTDYRLSAQVTIRKPAPKADFTVFSAEFDRYLPRDWFPPMCQHTGQYRYRYYAGEFDWGSDAAVFVRYQDRENCYRVQLSTEYQEMILWHGLGGYLAVVPCRLEPGRTYRLEVLAQGPHVQVLLDGAKKIDYWHRCLPTLSGGIGLGTYRATVAFQNVQVTALPPAGPAPPHRAKFATRRWRGLRWVFDGDEPIVLWEKGRTEPPGYTAGMLHYFFVKLRPGYRPMYQAWVGVRPDYPENAGCALVGTVDDIKTSGENTDRLVAQFATAQPGGTCEVANTDTLTFDSLRGTYRHEMTAEITWLKEAKMPFLEFCDPLTYNNKEPGRSNKYRWLPAGQEWGLFNGPNGVVYRHPISQSLNLDGQNGWYTEPGDSYWVLYPDRAVCPVWEHLTPNERSHMGVCHWGYDWHQYVYWGWDKQRTFQPGEKFTVRYTMAGWTPEETERLFRRSVLAPQNDQPEPPGKRAGFLLVPSMFAFPVCEPAGTSFDQLFNTRVPYIGWQWYGDYDNDRQVGRTDHYSMRLTGPARVSGQFYHHMIDGNASRYLCTFWLKTQGVKGPAPVAILQYPWNEEVPKDVLDTGLIGDNDWTEFSFVSKVPVVTAQTYDSSEFIIEHKGLGTVWLDDWSVRPLADDEKVTEKRPAAAPAPTQVSADFLLDLPCDEGEGVGCLDASGHGNSLKLHGVTWVPAGNRPVLHFENEACAFVPAPSPELRPVEGKYPGDSLTLEAWVRPAAGQGGGAILGYFNSPWLYLSPVGNDFVLNFGVVASGKGETLSSQPVVAGDEWTHVAATVGTDNLARLYVNGQMVAEKALPEKIQFGGYWAMISVGTYGKLYGRPYTGDLAGLRWWSRAATPEEVAAAAQRPPG